MSEVEQQEKENLVEQNFIGDDEEVARPLSKGEQAKLGAGVVTVAIVFLLAVIMFGQPASKLVYVFEVVRHGARAQCPEGNYGFKLPPGILTPMGIRQRYLLGKYNYNKYKDSLDFPEILTAPVVVDLNAISTDVYRTIQSGYSELFGLQEAALPRLQLSQAQQGNLKSNTRGLPAFTVRNQTQIQDELQADAILLGYVHIPIFTNDDRSHWSAPIDQAMCPLSAAIHHQRKLPAVKVKNMQSFDWIADDIKAKMDTQFKLNATQIQGAGDLNDWDDITVAQLFDGIKQNVTWTSEELLEIHLALTMDLVAFNTNLARKLWISHLMINTFKDMKAIVALGERPASVPQYRFYSAHDYQIANIMVQIDPEYLLNRIDYAATVFFELYNNGHGGFSVKTIYDGQTLQFAECGGQDLCSWEDFLTRMEGRLILDEASLRTQCAGSPTAAQLENDAVSDWHWDEGIKAARDKSEVLSDSHEAWIDKSKAQHMDLTTLSSIYA